MIWELNTYFDIAIDLMSLCITLPLKSTDLNVFNFGWIIPIGYFLLDPPPHLFHSRWQNERSLFLMFS